MMVCAPWNDAAHERTNGFAWEAKRERSELRHKVYRKFFVKTVGVYPTMGLFFAAHRRTSQPFAIISRMRLMLSVVALLASGCASSPLAPAAVKPLPIALAGQSNALFMREALTRAAAPAPVVGFAQDGSTIAQWSPSGFWPMLMPSLHQPLKAFIWWQGESDRADANVYADALREFLGRVRAEAHDPSLLIVVCRVIDDPAFVGIRAVQDAYVQSDPRSVLVSSDGLPLEGPGSAHLNSFGYDLMAQRVLAAIR